MPFASDSDSDSSFAAHVNGGSYEHLSDRGIYMKPDKLNFNLEDSYSNSQGLADLQNNVSSKPSPRPLSAVQMALPFSQQQESSARVNHNWRYSFEDFVVGPSNELAFAASRCMTASAAAPDILYLHSSPGLGKTHLIQAVGKSLCTSSNRPAQVEYLTAEEFTSRFFFSLKTQATEQFKARYRDVDLLLLEDVHFLQGKNAMQAELLGTIKALSERGAKVVFTSSFAANELRDMDNQLQSRLCSGLLSPIDKPDEETRRRILRSKAKAFQVVLPEDVEDVLAQHIRTDVRQIESCLKNLVLKAQVFNSEISMEMALNIIRNYADTTPILDMDAIIHHVCQGFNLTREQLSSNSRRQELVAARNTAFYLARKHTDLSLQAIGRYFNRRHSTVLKGITNLERAMGHQTPAGRQSAQIVAMVERNSGSGPELHN